MAARVERTRVRIEAERDSGSRTLQRLCRRRKDARELASRFAIRKIILEQASVYQYARERAGLLSTLPRASLSPVRVLHKFVSICFRRKCIEVRSKRLTRIRERVLTAGSHDAAAESLLAQRREARRKKDPSVPPTEKLRTADAREQPSAVPVPS